MDIMQETFMPGNAKGVMLSHRNLCRNIAASYNAHPCDCIDAKGRFAIKGRLNTVILGPSGENIYPEEIENVINGIDDIEESLVVQRKGRLVALVLLKDTLKDRLHLSSKEHERLKQEIMDFVNRHVSRFSRITDVEFVKEAFEKTATHKIRRMKYCQA